MSVLTTITTVLVALAALVTALKVLTGFAPVQWLWRRLVHDPVQEGLRSVIREEVKPLLLEVVKELKPNGGSTVRDAIDRIEKKA